MGTKFLYNFISLSSIFYLLPFFVLKAQSTSELGTGIEDDFEIMSDMTCQDYPTDKLTPTSTYSYKVCYHDCEPFNMPPANFKWKLELFYKDRSNNIDSTCLVTADGYLTDPFDYTYSMFVPNLPSWTNGNTWLRNMDGTLKAKLSVSAFEGFYAEMDMKIVYFPNVPTSKVTIHNCQSATLDFYSDGASSYIIHYSTTPGEPYENVVNVPTRTYSYTFSGLSKLNDYYFIVEAINDDGLSAWGPQVTKSRCSSSN